MKIKEQTRKLAAGCSKHCFEVADRTDEVSSKHCFEVVDRTDEVSNHTYGKVKLTWFEEIFEEYKSFFYHLSSISRYLMKNSLISIVKLRELSFSELKFSEKSVH